jgi:site-specific DNA-methyltransferase (adenine-specific)
MSKWQVINGDNSEVLKTYPDNYFDCVVTDPPYGISFLGKDWDSKKATETTSKLSQLHNLPSGMKHTGLADDLEFQKWMSNVFSECLRVLKPGGHLLAFSAARTYHHMAMAAQFAGFEIRDQIMWIYGSGFPKSQDVGKSIERTEKKRADNALGIKRSKIESGPKTNCPKCNKTLNGTNQNTCEESQCDLRDALAPADNEWSGWGTALKPAHEPIVMARKPISEKNIALNCQKHGTGAINIDATRVGDEKITTIGGWTEEHDWESRTTYNKINETHVGRFPANVIHDGSDEVVSLFPHSISGARKSTHKLKGLDTGEQRAVFGDDAISGKYNVQPFTDAQADEGSAARFFYCPKVSRKERHTGFDLSTIPTDPSGKFDDGGYSQKQETLKAAGNNHPTVKPIELMKYLIKLVTPPNGHILDPFNGSGSTGCAAVELGFDYTGIELDPHYVEIAVKRITACEERTKPSHYENLFYEK